MLTIPPFTGNNELDAFLFEIANNIAANMGISAPIPNTGGGAATGYTNQYLHIKYATDNVGTGLSDLPANKTYFGVYNSTTTTESTNPADYTWYLAQDGFSTTRFLWYSLLGNRATKFNVSAVSPGSRWVLDPGTAIDLDNIVSAGTVNTNDIVDGAVTSNKIPSGAITETKISNEAITTLKIAEGAVTAAKTNIAALDQATGGLKTNTVSAAQIMTDAVTNIKLAAGAVTEAKVGTGAITTTKISNTAITTDKLAANAVVADKIAANTITGNKIAAETIGAGAIAAGAITTVKLEAGAVVADKIAANAVTSAKIVAGAIETVKLAANSVTGDKVSANTLSVNKLLSGTQSTQGGVTFGFGLGTAIYGLATAGYFKTTNTGTAGLAGISTTNVGLVGNTGSASSFGSLVSNTFGVDSVDPIYVITGVGLAGPNYGLFTQRRSAQGSPAGFEPGTNTASYATLAYLSGSAHYGGRMYTTTTSGADARGITVGGPTYGLTVLGGTSPFTGCHDGILSKDTPITIGDIVVDTGVIVAKLGVTDTLTEVTTSTTPNQKGAVGIYADISSQTPHILQEAVTLTVTENGVTFDKVTYQLKPTYQWVEDDYNYVAINSIGEGQINVCGEGGDISVGDLIVTSSLPGKGMKQTDDIIRSYTVAKSRENITFTSTTQVKQIACIYLAG
jgi:hypothetical protein